MRTAFLLILTVMVASACSSGTNPFAPETSAAPSDMSSEGYACLRAYASQNGGTEVVDALLQRLRGQALREGITVDQALRQMLRESSQVPPACARLPA